MGGKPSKGPKAPSTDLNRSKSVSTFGRSSQRSLFQKSKARLFQLNKKIQEIKQDDPAAFQKINSQLEGVEKDLNDISQAIKEKNKQKYEEVLKHLQETRQKFEEAKPKEDEAKIEDVQPPLKPARSPQFVEVKLVRVISTEDLDQDVEMRKPAERQSSEENSERPHSPKVKFGVQVMPINPRVSQELLKRKTLPTNEAAKAEFLQIRKMSDSDASQGHHDGEEQMSAMEVNELYNFPPPENFADRAESPRESNLYSVPSSPSSNLKTLQGKPLEELRPVNADALQHIENVAREVDVLEDRLKYFCGVKGDPEYLELSERFIRSLIKLDNVETCGDSVVRQEKKIAIQRTQELIRILECLVKQTEEEKNSKVDEGQDYDTVGEKPEENGVVGGKPVTATAL